MITWRTIDQKTGEAAKRNYHSFEPHDYIADEAHLKIINNSFSLKKVDGRSQP